MKRLFTIIVALAISGICYASEPYTAYCTIRGEESMSNPGNIVGNVEIDYGQTSRRKSYLTDSTGKRIEFESMVAAMNYMAGYGWSLHDSYTTVKRMPIDNRQLDRIVVVWILKKEVTSSAEITEGLASSSLDYLSY
ncbi:MAG: hypothetical protein J6R90_07680 [Alistipes sp.]|nr:hypothetical protein [Alistipes sp.]